MIWKWRILNWRITFTIAPVVDVVGVNSNLPDNNHIIMWDFDDTDLATVVRELSTVQIKYNLPRIYIFETKKRQNYIAFCFKRCSWEKSVEIVACTRGVDRNFFKYGVYREHWTLRVTPKNGRKIRLITILESKAHEDCSIRELKSWVKYETLRGE